MRTRLLTTLALITLASFGFAASATAQKPATSVKKTSEFRQLKGYVATLFAKRNVETTNSQKRAYKSKLKTRRTKANLKAGALYNSQVRRISKRDDKKQRRTIKRIRQTQKVRVANIRGNLTSRLNALNVKQNIAVDAVNGRYANRIDPLTRKRTILQKRLNKTKKPTKRTKIAAKITAVQRQLNKLVDARQAAANGVVAKYNSRAANVKVIFAGRVAKAKAAAARDISVANNAYKQLFREALKLARKKKTADVALITGLSDRGTGYIEEMPVA